jgi:NADPH:quinone reductase-like Zn-dependent oxidoreductase
MMDTLFAGILSGIYRPVTSMTYPLERYADAFDAIVSRKSVGRVLLKI